MKTKAELQEDKIKYEAIKEQLGKITSKLSTASTSMGSVDREVKATYKVNGDSAKISKKTARLKECVDTVSSNITLILIPAINLAIQASETAIKNIEAAEEAERQAAEEAERQAAEQAANAAQPTKIPTNVEPIQSSIDPNEDRYQRGA